MNQTDKLSREVLNLLNYSKDVILNNLNKANASGIFEPPLTEQQLKSTFSVIENSATEGYQKAIITFQKTIKFLLSENNQTKTVVETKKKK